MSCASRRGPGTAVSGEISIAAAWRSACTQRAPCARRSSGCAPAHPAAEAATPRGTTHISVVDERGNAAALTVSTGLRLRRDRPRNGDPAQQHARRVRSRPRGGDPRPGRQADEHDGADSSSLKDGRPRLVVGSAGSVAPAWRDPPGRRERRSPRPAGRGGDLGAAHSCGRRPSCTARAAHDPAELGRLEALGYELVRWQERNLYFGGASAVEMLPDGTLAAAGDPRRGGHGIVVPK